MSFPYTYTRRCKKTSLAKIQEGVTSIEKDVSEISLDLKEVKSCVDNLCGENNMPIIANSKDTVFRVIL